MLNIDDDDFEIVRGIDGRPVRVLKDGGRMRVSMQMRDSALRDQRGGRLHDGRGNYDVVGHKPGFVMSDRVQRPRSIYDRYDAEKSAEWKNPPTGFGSKGQRGQHEGDICTFNGAPGHLQMRGGELVCVPDRCSDQPDPASDRRSIADEYAAYDVRISQAWRNPE
jgi:hypothetical protein